MHLDAITGHARARALLRHAVEEDRRSRADHGSGSRAVSHAYLFTGPAESGKTATALAFAADLLEAAGSPPPNGAHADLWVEDSDSEQVSIDMIRLDGRTAKQGEEMPAGTPVQTLQAFLSLRGMHSDRRVAVLARAERLREAASAPLLKTIEEPPAGAVIILCAEAADLLPATINSRCQEVEFGVLSDEEMRGFLAGRGLEPTRAVLRLARGCPGRALRLADDPAEVERRIGWAGALEAIATGSWIDIVSLGARFAASDARSNRAQAREALEVWEAWLRDFAISRAGAPELTGASDPSEPQDDGRHPAVSGAAWAEAASPAWSAVGLEQVLTIWESAREAADRVYNNVNPRLAVEVFLADVQGAVVP